jgi:cell division protein FtsB
MAKLRCHYFKAELPLPALTGFILRDGTRLADRGDRRQEPGRKIQGHFAKVGSLNLVRENFRLTRGQKAAFTEELHADPKEPDGRKAGQTVGIDGLKQIVCAHVPEEGHSMMEAKTKIDAQEPVDRTEPLAEVALVKAQRLWRPAGTGIAVVLALLVTWHVVYGKHGLSVWQQQRTEDRTLQQEIKDLDEQNAQMRQQIQRLQTDPLAIAHEARQRLHYAKPGEVIITLEDQPPAQPVK